MHGESAKCSQWLLLTIIRCAVERIQDITGIEE